MQQGCGTEDTAAEWPDGRDVAARQLQRLAGQHDWHLRVLKSHVHVRLCTERHEGVTGRLRCSIHVQDP